VPAVVVEDKGRWFALSMSPVTAEPGDQGAGQHRRKGHGVTDDSAFKKQVRARMGETGEKYTDARRVVIAEQLRAEEEAAQQAAIRDAVQRAIDRVVGVSAVEVSQTADRVKVSIRAARPTFLVGPRGDEADLLRGEIEELTGRQVQLSIWQVPDPQEEPTSAPG
jgi:hypothetical protein